MDRALLTKRAQVLLCVANDCDSRMRDIAESIGITERAAYDLVCELVKEGYLTRERNGRRNCYRLHPEKAPRAADERRDLSRLIALLGEREAEVHAEHSS